MEMFSTAKVFNPELSGRAVRITGHDIEGEYCDRLFLVKSVKGEYITVVNCQGTVIGDIHLENFDHPDDPLKITVLKEAV